MTEKANNTPTKPIYITDQDKTRLLEMIGEIQRQKNQCQRDDLDALADELDRASVVEPEMIPKDVVTMNSRVSIVNLDSSEQVSFTLVFPEDVNPEEKTVSVIDSMGSAIIGYKTGEIFEWDAPWETCRYQISKIEYQPEANKHYHL